MIRTICSWTHRRTCMFSANWVLESVKMVIQYFKTCKYFCKTIYEIGCVIILFYWQYAGTHFIRSIEIHSFAPGIENVFVCKCLLWNLCNGSSWQRPLVSPLELISAINNLILALTIPLSFSSLFQTLLHSKDCLTHRG